VRRLTRCAQRRYSCLRCPSLSIRQQGSLCVHQRRTTAAQAYAGSVTTKRFALVALLLAVAGALVAAFAPTGHVVESVGSPGGVIMTRSYNVSIFQTEGSWVLVVVSVPVLVALVPVLVRHRSARIVSAVLLWTLCVVGMWSVGIFFIPAAIVMTVAAARRERALVPPMPPYSAPG
jgi:hypothetical protein